MYRIDKVIGIIKKCQEEKIEIKWSTVYEGFSIGKAIIQLRSDIKTRRVIPTEEQLEELADLGVLDGGRQLKPIDANIDYLVGWKERYPQLPIKTSPLSEQELEIYAKTDEEKEALRKNYKIINDKLAYVLRRKNAGKLSTNQINKCKEGYLGDVFGYPEEIERASEKYGISPEKIRYIVAKYFRTLAEQREANNIEAAIDQLLQDFLKNRLSEKDLKVLDGNLINVLEIKQNNEMYRKLIQSVTNSIEGQNHKLFFYSELGLTSILRSGSKKDEEMGRYLEDRFIKSHHKKLTKTREAKMKVSRSRVNIIIRRIKDRIIKNISVAIPLIIDISQKQADAKEDELVDKLIKLLIRERVLLYPDDDKKPERKEFREINGIITTILDKRQTEDIIKNGTIFQKASVGLLEMKELETTDISELGLRLNFDRTLRENDIDTVYKLMNVSNVQLEQMGLSKKELCKIRKLLRALGVTRVAERTDENPNKCNRIEDLDVKGKVLRMLIDQFGSLNNLKNCTLESFTEKVVGKIAYAEVLDALDKAGISFINEKSVEFHVGQWNQRDEEEK